MRHSWRIGLVFAVTVVLTLATLSLPGLVAEWLSYSDI